MRSEVELSRPPLFDAGAGAALRMPSFSFVIPTLNEAEDIAATLDAVLGQRLPPLEVIVVDGGSTDGTREIVRAYVSRGPVRVVEGGERPGVGAARNAGIREAAGDVVVILNADVRPAPDFLERLAPLYLAGYDCVSVEARVENLSDATGRFIQAEHELRYGSGRTGRVGWTEGFSCRRQLARVAAFPEEIPGAGGEDVLFFERLRARDAAWRFEPSVVVTHRTPSTLRAFWRQWRGRGEAVPYLEWRVLGLPFAAVVGRRALATAWTLALGITLVAPLVGAWRRARRSPRGLRDLAVFWALDHARMLAHRSGEWRSLLRIWREKR